MLLEREILGFGVDAGLDKVLVLPGKRKISLRFQLLSFPFQGAAKILLGSDLAHLA